MTWIAAGAGSVATAESGLLSAVSDGLRRRARPQPPQTHRKPRSPHIALKPTLEPSAEPLGLPVDKVSDQAANDASQLSEETLRRGKIAGKIGMDRALNADCGSWSDKAYEGVLRYMKTPEARQHVYLAEDIKMIARRFSGQEPSPNSIGGFIRMLKGREVIECTGQRMPMRAETSHARMTDVYRFVFNDEGFKEQSHIGGEVPPSSAPAAVPVEGQKQQSLIPFLQLVHSAASAADPLAGI